VSCSLSLARPAPDMDPSHVSSPSRSHFPLSSFSTSRIKIFYTTLQQSAQSLQGTLPSGMTKPDDSLSSSTAFPPRCQAAGYPCTPQYSISFGSLGVPCRPMCMVRIDFGFRSWHLRTRSLRSEAENRWEYEPLLRQRGGCLGTDKALMYQERMERGCRIEG
jgi:hypothetical protein